MMPTVRLGRVAARRPESPAGSPPGRRRPTPTATAQALQTVAALSSRNSGRNVILHLSTTTAAILSRALPIRRPRARTRRRELIPLQAAAIQLRRPPTPHLAGAIAVVVGDMAAAAIVAAMAVGVAAVTAVAVAVGVARAVVVAAEIAAAAVEEARTVAEAPALTRGANLFAKTIARPDLPDGLFVFRPQLELKFSLPRIS